MLNNTQTLPNGTYDKTIQGYGNSSFSVEDPTFLVNRKLTVSHTTSKSGQVSTVAYIDDKQSTDPLKTPSNIRVQVKFQYNPLEGRTDTLAAINSLKADLDAFITSNLGSLLNKES
jgi:hypothetical protein